MPDRKEGATAQSYQGVEVVHHAYGAAIYGDIPLNKLQVIAGHLREDYGYNMIDGVLGEELGATVVITTPGLSERWRRKLQQE